MVQGILVGVRPCDLYVLKSQPENGWEVRLSWMLNSLFTGYFQCLC